MPVGVHDLERSCVEPGHHLVEGHRVTRARRGRWLVFAAFGTPPPQVATAESFREALGWIVDHLNEGCDC